MKKRLEIIVTVTIMCMLIFGMGTMVFGYSETKEFFAGQLVNSTVSLLGDDSMGVTENGTYPSTVKWKINKTTAEYYYGFKKRLGDGTYGGATGSKYKMLSTVSSGAKTIKLYLNVSRWKPYIAGGSGSYFVLDKVCVSVD